MSGFEMVQTPMWHAVLSIIHGLVGIGVSYIDIG